MCSWEERLDWTRATSAAGARENEDEVPAKKVPVFGILERNGVVQVTVVPDVTTHTLLGLTVKEVLRGSVVYTDKFKSCDSLMFCGYRHLSVDHQKRFSSVKCISTAWRDSGSGARNASSNIMASPRITPLSI
jgi:hypothetical protein